MPIEYIHSYLVHPQKNRTGGEKIKGTSVPLEGKLFGLLSDIYSKAETQCDIEISFNSAEDGSQSNACRNLIVDYLNGPNLPKGRKLAERLQGVTTGRSGIGLLFLVAGKEGRNAKIALSRFPTDVAILAEETKDELSVSFLERVFMKNATAYKAVVYSDASLNAGFWTGKAVDRQINDRVTQVSNYWIADFLASGFQITAAQGTRRLALAMRQAARLASDVTVKSEIAAAVTLAKALKGRRGSILQFQDMLNLSDQTRQLMNKGMKEYLNDQFQFDFKEFSEHLAYRSIELDNGAILTAEAPKFDEVFHRDQVQRAAGKSRFSTEGRVVSERLGKSKIERLGK